jgi:hypothetical protein
MALNDYLTKHYLTSDADPRPKKKKKRKQEERVEVLDQDIEWRTVGNDEDEVIEGAGEPTLKIQGTWVDGEGNVIEDKEEEKEEEKPEERHEETVYRDASGRRIDAMMMRAEARRKAEVEADAQKGLQEGTVQRKQRQQEAKDLEKAKDAPLAVYKDDVQRNEELKAKVRWNDPAAGFISSKTTESGKGLRNKFAASAPPNRFGIPPGRHWDGVERSNGFERRWLDRQSESIDQRPDDYALDSDDE